ncbi:MAG: phage integrase SAM-like domain-containing protein [Vicingaceae bacterium]|nr:phage integrase SAM-like domain-containing protein [Vicingaceae bacterium]
MKTTKKVFIKKQLNKKSNLFPLHLRIIHNEVKAEGLITEIDGVTAQQLKKWNDKEERFENILPEYNEIIALINKNFRELKIIKRVSFHQLTAKEIRDILLERKTKKKEKPLISHYTDYLENEIYNNPNLTIGTKKNYRKSFTHFNTYLEQASLYKIELENFTPQHANGFKTYLTNKMMYVSAQSVLKNVKPFFERKYEEDIIRLNPFKRINIRFTRSEQTRIEPIHFYNINHINLYNFKNLELYIDIFNLMCLTGLAFGDLFEVKRSQLLHKSSGLFFLDYRRVKTNGVVQQFLPKKVIEIMAKYENHPDVQILDTLVPKKCLNEVNKKLKIIGALANFPYPLTTYHARRFFRQSLKHAGIYEEVEVKTLMGHSTFGIIDAVYYTVEPKTFIEIKRKLDNYFDSLLINVKSLQI